MSFDTLAWRFIGPTRGGRVVAVAGHPRQPAVFYFGSSGGGVWQTTSAGQRWQNVSDGFFQRASVGALAIAPSDPNVIYAGMGETSIRGNVSHGDGIYKSTDAGQSWAHCGLASTRHIGRVRVHPHNAELVYVAALGHAHGPSPDRGVYRSDDGGRSWELLLFASEQAGAVDLALDSNNPRVLYAATWEARRGPHFMTSGGPGSGLYRSTDGGDNWLDFSEMPGLPKGAKGKIGVAVSPAMSGRVWAIVEHADGGLFRSDDAGESWVRINQDGDLLQRAWYYSHIIADPRDAETVWVLNLGCWRSVDGGRTFAWVTTPHVDHHDLWIDPADPRRMILGCDGGATVSLNGGEDWSATDNQPTGELYHVTTDTREPYRVYGAQQDDSTISIPSRSTLGCISPMDWYSVGGGESGYIAVRPDNPDVIFAGNQQGNMTRYNHRIGELRDTSIWPEHVWGWDAKDHTYRFAWTYPITLSPHDPNTIYAGANYVFRSTDEGRTWERISGDLTRNDPAYQQPVGPLGENARAEAYGTVFAIAESPLRRGVIWVGSDDGLVHITGDGGETWEDVTPVDLPAWSLISIIEPSPHDPATAHLVAERHKLDDFRPYVFTTFDYGRHWTAITDGIAVNDFVRVVREDSKRRGLLFAGTETGVYVSFPETPAGRAPDKPRWQRLTDVPAVQAEHAFPVVPVHDLVIKDDDLVVCTHGRGFWILDDLSILRQWDAGPLDVPAHLFEPRAARRWALRAGAWPTGPAGVIVRYLLARSLDEELQLTFLDKQGSEIRTFTSGASADGSPSVPANAGLNQFIWDMRYPDPPKVLSGRGDRMNARGPRVVPGDYQVRMRVGELSRLAHFAILPDPRSSATTEDLVAQFNLLMQIHETLAATNLAINQIRDIRQQISEWMLRLHCSDCGEQLWAARDAVMAKLAAIEDQLIQVEANNMEDTLRLPARLNAKLTWLSMTVGGSANAPTPQASQLFEELAGRVNRELDRLRRAIESDVEAFNEIIERLAIPPVVVR